MKKFTLRLWLFGMMALMLSGGIAKACDLSDMTFLGITGNGPYVISVRLCVGMGRTLAVLGGDQSTRTFMFAFWDSQPGFVISAFTPASVTGPPTTFQSGVCNTATVGCTNLGGISTTLLFQGSNAVVRYAQQGAPCGSNKAYGCVTTTCGCGPAQAYCFDHTMTVNQIPDSMRATGIEGAGNNIAGCYPNADMKIDFNALLSVIWGDISGERSTAGVNVKWTTNQETDVDYFIVERAIDGQQFEAIGQVPATGFSTSAVKYSFFDAAPHPGTNRYRLVSVDQSGSSHDSETIEVNYFKPEGLSWGAVGPNPASDYIDMTFFSPVSGKVAYQLFDVAGKRVIYQEVDVVLGGNTARVDLSALDRGNYFLTVQQGTEKLVRKIVRL
jgi:Secretion system C-terminal sorting domain